MANNMGAKGAMRIPANLVIKKFYLTADSSALVIGLERTNSLHGLYIRGRED